MEKKIFGKTDGIRAKAGEGPLTEKMLARLGRAIARYFGGGRICMGRDTRESGKWIIDYIKMGILEVGGENVEIKDYGILPTPALAALTKGDGAAIAGVMVTASHNPAEDNGVKIFDRDGNKVSDEVELALENLIFSDEAGVEVSRSAGKIEVEGCLKEAVSYYEEMLRGKLNVGVLRGGRILVDSAAGAAYDFGAKLWADFGVEVKEFGKKPDGRNINLNCGALYPDNLAEKMRSLKDGEAAVGVCLDGDADRIILIDEGGRIWDGDRIIAAMAGWLKEHGELTENAVVLTEYSNLGVVRYLNGLGVKVHKVVNGDKEVARKCQEVGAVLGGERSGHIIYMPWLSSSDGTMIAVWFLSKVMEEGRKLEDLWPDYDEVPSDQWSLTVREKRALELLDGWEEEFIAQEKNLGISGRIFVRYSGTENKIRILVEAEDEKAMKEAGDRLSKIIEKEIGL